MAGLSPVSAAAASAAPQLAVVVVNYEAGEVLRQCIAHLAASLLPLQILVVDNASSDGSLAGLETLALPQRHRLEVLRLPRNLGFGAACNRGVAATTAPWLVLLNPDCLVAPDSLERLLAHAQADPSIGLIGAAMRNPDGSLQRAVRRRDPTPWRSLMTLSGLARFETRWPLLQGVEAPAATPPCALESVDAVSGALMLLPRPVFEALGGFDEGYFLHCEDLDLCRRVRAAGWRVVLAGEVEVRHIQGVCSRRAPLRVHWHKHRGMWRYYRRYDGARHLWPLRGLIAAGIALRFLLWLPFASWPRR